ncbi:Tripartite motif-containing protein 39 [Chelonia mydas]|uniref:Tripartite motif-containing protein 39 n=1 Tax=Chelonia mydas TaxID=8469 RepID=M7AVW8_CHEMY|nr:Tripartite motif-containing protein 39 [Chelonia mydas]
MASAAPLRNALEEATCSICLEYLTELVTIDCGHNFCRVCITQYSEHGEPESDTKFPCPQWRAPFQKQKLRPNTQLADIVENIKKLRLQPWKEQKKNLCERHQEVKLQGALGPLRKQLEEFLALASKEEKKTRVAVTREFKKLHQFLSEEEQLLLRRLAEEEREILQRLQDNITKLSEQNAALINLITELEEKCQQPAVELLKDMKNALIRSENVTLQQPGAVSPALKNMYKVHIDMREMLERFTGTSLIPSPTLYPLVSAPTLPP